MLLLKRCPRCKGDVFVDRDQFGWFEQCLQCGHTADFAGAPGEVPQLVQQRVESCQTRGQLAIRLEHPTQMCSHPVCK